MKEELIKLITNLEQKIKEYEKNPYNISYTGVLLERAVPKHAWLCGKLHAYKYALQLLEKERGM